ncbi:unnamed protein product [Adineta ricciae]|uniref:Uncharacterized protein n=1 Tax=Adineta ricciae TaxID=249248 RepID=A0A814GXW8_ADIRI|nr:unnamed protein product [Adineta ricciae]
MSSSHFIPEMSYPPYCIQPLKPWGLIVIGSGGGSTKTGAGNDVHLKWTHLNPSTNSNHQRCSVQNQSNFSQQDSVMRMISVTKQQEYLILVQNQHLKVIMPKACHTDFDDNPRNSMPLPRTCSMCQHYQKRYGSGKFISV